MTGPVLRKVPERHDQKQTQQGTGDEVELSIIYKWARGKVYVNFHELSFSLRPVREMTANEFSDFLIRNAAENGNISSDLSLLPGTVKSLREWRTPREGPHGSMRHKSW